MCVDGQGVLVGRWVLGDETFHYTDCRMQG